MFRRGAGKIGCGAFQMQRDFRNPADEFEIAVRGRRFDERDVFRIPHGKLNGKQFGGVAETAVKPCKEADRLRKEVYQEKIGDPLFIRENRRETEESGLIELPEPRPVAGERAERDIGEIGVADLFGLNENGVGQKHERLLQMHLQFRQTEFFRDVFGRLNGEHKPEV